MAEISNVRARVLYGLSKMPTVRRFSESFGRAANRVLNPIGLRYVTDMTFNIATFRASRDKLEARIAAEELFYSGHNRALKVLASDHLEREFSIIYSGTEHPYYNYFRFYSGMLTPIYKACELAGLSLSQSEELMSRIIRTNKELLDKQYSYHDEVIDEFAARSRAEMRVEIKYLPLLIGAASDTGRKPDAIVYFVPIIYKSKLAEVELGKHILDLVMEFDLRVSEA